MLTRSEIAKFQRSGLRRRKKKSAAWYVTHPSPLSSPKEIVGSHGHKPAGPSIRWPAMYRHLRAKGYTKRKAAMISNGKWRRKHGLPPKSVPGTKGKVRITKSTPEARNVHSPRPLGEAMSPKAAKSAEMLRKKKRCGICGELNCKKHR